MLVAHYNRETVDWKSKVVDWVSLFRFTDNWSKWIARVTLRRYSLGMLATGIQVFVSPNCRAKVLLRFRGYTTAKAGKRYREATNIAGSGHYHRAECRRVRLHDHQVDGHLKVHPALQGLGES